VRPLVRLAAAAAVVLAASIGLGAGTAPGADTISPDDAKAVAEEAYVFAYPMLENYRTMFVQAIDPQSKAYTGPFNQLHHATALAGPESRAVVRPNNDTLYSTAWLDLRAEPIVIGVPAIRDQRYYSVQLIDLYTHNLGYIGSRVTGFDKSYYVIAGPGWTGDKPARAASVFRSEGHLVYAIIRTAVQGPADVAAVRAIQKQYTLAPLSKFLGRPAVKRTALEFPHFDQHRADGAGFIGYTNFLLGQLAPHPSEQALLERFATLGIGPNRRFDAARLSPEVRRAIEDGVAGARAKIAAQKLGAEKNGWTLVMGAFGNRERMQGNYLVRAAAARLGLYGNDQEEALYPATQVDVNGNALDGSKNRYVIRFGKAQVPPVKSFWSMTMYGLPSQLMIANPIRRYSIGDRTSGLKSGLDGSVTIYVQTRSPGPSLETNWLPAPKGPFSLQMRMYWPRADAFTPEPYAPPPVEVAQ
jgi:hypothetical protein